MKKNAESEYKFKYTKLSNNPHLHPIVEEISKEFNISKMEVAYYIEYFFKWQKQALDNLESYSFMWNFFGNIQIDNKDIIQNWDKFKHEQQQKLNHLKSSLSKHQERRKINQLTNLKSKENGENE